MLGCFGTAYWVPAAALGRGLIISVSAHAAGLSLAVSLRERTS